MRVIVISAEPFLSEFLRVANKNLDIAALVIPMPQLVKGSNINIGDKVNTRLYSYSYLKECLSELYYNYIIIAAMPWSEIEKISLEDLENLNIDKKKIFRVGVIYTAYCYAFVHQYNYVKENISKYKVMVLGSSHAWKATDTTCYELPTLNCAMSSQDLFYDYQFAKRYLELENSTFKYIILEMRPYSFSYDESLGGGVASEQFFLLMYYLTFKDVHNFHVDDESMKQIFSSDFLQLKGIACPKDFNIDDYTSRSSQKEINLMDLMKCRNSVDRWQNRHFPKTIEENKKILFDLMELCKKHNVTPILTIFPTIAIWREFFPKKMVDEFYVIISEAKKMYNFHFIDKSNFDDTLELKDFHDGNHLNYRGAQKMSKFLSDYIMKLENNKS